uniref:Uncharacterized protein n=1 Tax=Panagrolaimus davidi TaxID=227884 RepID=A0A914PK70_9BILA
MWKSKITSRLCDSCKKMLEEKIKTAYAEFENDGESNESEGKKKKKKEGDQNELLSSQPQTLYNTTATPVAGPSSSARILPSINTLLHPQERDDNFTNLFLSYDNPSLEDSMEMSIDNLPFEAMEIDENPITGF